MHFRSKANRFVFSFAIFVFLFSISSPAFADILFRDTFEDEPTWSPWSINVSGSGAWLRKTEDNTDDYASQLHGDFSLWIKDPDNNSHALAKREFPPFGMIPNHPEYMVEFYFWWQENATLDSFYLYKPIKNSNLADISIQLVSYQDTTINSDQTRKADYVEETFQFVVSDSNGNHSVSHKDTILELLEVDTVYSDHKLRWHKFQVHKLFDSDTIILYIDGTPIDTFKSASGTNHPDSFLIGTTDTLQNGEGFWDDFIITTVPNGNHPRLFFSQSDIDSLKTKATNTHSTILDYSYKQMADTVITLANSCCDW